ncbi:MAG TPA: hypothetical protein VKN73_06670 [Desulfosalsimonadaceae bacterium]|nr:hypothetical protein [Desulfosalsimonadaceae bacterium]
MKQPFTRKDLATDGCSVLRKGRWANADLYLYEENDVAWVVKDFLPCAPIVRKTWGRFLVQREFHALDRLQGVAGIPQAPFIIDAHALGYRYIPGRTLRDTPSELIDASFFKQLEMLVEEMHKRNMVHLDSRNRRNVLITDEGRPALLDFQSSLNLDRVPRNFHHLLKEIDLSGVYKLWQLKTPDTMDAARKERLMEFDKKRFLWVLRGYPLGTRKAPRS